MSIILKTDILYNILPYIDLTCIGKLFCVNKIINKLCSDKHFWKTKFNNDYKNVISKNNNWLCEYKNVSLAYIQTIKFVDHFIKCAQIYKPRILPDTFSICIRGIVSYSDLYWISEKSQMQLRKYPPPSIFLGRHKGKYETLIEYPFFVSVTNKTGFSEPAYINMCKREFINYVTKLHYDYGNFAIYNRSNVSILFTNYVNK